MVSERRGWFWAMAIGALVYVFALTMAVAWHWHMVQVIQWRPGYAPVQYNAALGLIACALGLITLTARAAPPCCSAPWARCWAR